MNRIQKFLLAAAASAAIAPIAAQAADDIIEPVIAPPSVYPTWYVRGEAGGSWLAENRGFWCGPGCAVPPPGQDPRIIFDLDSGVAFTGNVGVGAEVMQGVRLDVSAGYTGGQRVDADWNRSLTPPPVNFTEHADIDATVSAFTGLVNLFIEPLALGGNDSPIQPFVTGGIGFANVRMDDWVRTNSDPAHPRPTRVFEGSSATNFAWSVGAGVSADLEEVVGQNVLLDLTYRYTDMGRVAGSGTPLPGQGNGVPEEPFNFNYRTHTVTIGVRVPFGT
ncbi:outer membrane protein [Oceaniradius stylonematis]|jgi:opacity protein-like surface antigen|uniref:outer membrane protein n=1 Tax=Oceaniradius stylonematis TaxID=2184161 RepID=UPI000F409845|nr:outer membrane beta-barrel protein [Oceaniradius stylonematis]RNC96701.1 MAG: porin family protein [Oricola sp.]